ncbi:hypothetical protein J6590_074110 [Homalodisca vitripennis]|nr:hypothetical protein J6590_074110 [Homalodisca vitripennis]
MLELFAFTQIYEIETREVPISFQHDGDPPNLHNHVRNILDDKRPDLTQMGFFLAQCQKIVHSEKIRNTDHLRERVRDAIESVTQEMLKHVWQEIESRFDTCRSIYGGHIEISKFIENHQTIDVMWCH